jgi:hypothetical protein
MTENQFHMAPEFLAQLVVKTLRASAIQRPTHSAVRHIDSGIAAGPAHQIG